MTISRLVPTFVDTFPERLDDGVLYVSIEFRTTMHLCACGCGNSVVLPLRPTAWSITYDGKSVSMRPSVGNWSFPCQSHYWIRNGNVVWARQWTAVQIEAGRQQTLEDRRAVTPDESPSEVHAPWWRRVLRALGLRERSNA